MAEDALNDSNNSYNNPCPEDYPYLREWSNSGELWCYKSINSSNNGAGDVCNMSESGKKHLLENGVQTKKMRI